MSATLLAGAMSMWPSTAHAGLTPVLLVPTISAPSVAYRALLPIFIVLGAALVGVLAEAVIPRRERFTAQVAITLLGLLAAIVAVVAVRNDTLTTPSPSGSNLPFAGSLAIDGAGLFIQARCWCSPSCPRCCSPSALWTWPARSWRRPR